MTRISTWTTTRMYWNGIRGGARGMDASTRSRRDHPILQKPEPLMRAGADVAGSWGRSSTRSCAAAPPLRRMTSVARLGIEIDSYAMEIAPNLTNQQALPMKCGKSPSIPTRPGAQPKPLWHGKHEAAAINLENTGRHGVAAGARQSRTFGGCDGQGTGDYRTAATMTTAPDTLIAAEHDRNVSCRTTWLRMARARLDAVSPFRFAPIQPAVSRPDDDSP